MKNIVITGASSGIGLGLKEYYISRGDKVIDISRKWKRFSVRHF